MSIAPFGPCVLARFVLPMGRDGGGDHRLAALRSVPGPRGRDRPPVVQGAPRAAAFWMDGEGAAADADRFARDGQLATL